MRVLLIIQDRSMPSSRVRVLNLLPELMRAGLACDVEVYPRRLADKVKLLARMRRYDAVLVQKKLASPVDVALIRRFSRKLIYDFDDAVYLRHESEGDENSRGREIKTRAIMRAADLVIAGNRILADYARALNPRVTVIPSCVETRSLPFRHHESGTQGPVVIGWVGGSINLGHLALIGPSLKEVARQCDIEMRILCDRTIELPGVKVTHVPWSLEGQAREIARFDIGVMPLPHSRHAGGKCGYKALQCMAAGVPVVVSDVGVNRDIVRDGVDGFVVREPEDFAGALLQLASSAGLRQRMGASACDRVMAGYTVAEGGRLLAEAIRSA